MMVMSMSDGITDAKRECKPIRYTSSRVNPAPSKCRNCIFIIRNPHDNKWECTNPLQHGPCNESNNCAFYLTIEELAVYFRQRLKAKLTGESKVSDKSTLRCKHILDDDCGKCSKIDEFRCPFVGMWDIAKTMCKGYDANVRYEVHVLGKSTSIIGVFKSREQAEHFIRDNIKVVEMIP